MPTLMQLILNEMAVTSLLEGSHYHSTFADWTAARSFICRALTGDGSILDIGCANGFLLKCLQHWSGRNLRVYGIDIDRERIHEARRLFPSEEGHFTELSTAKLDRLSEAGLPTTYTYVYWNIWDDFLLDTGEQRKSLRSAASAVIPGGRLILGFYDRDPASIAAKINRASDELGRPGGRIDNSPRREVLIWFDRVGET